ncbi:type II toxin-antitoxin system HigB family toxin [Edaphobacter aggregans]|uniref:type II toxin-antitoxin system HigB family toxin n=1 Tax=Edaphobacter aggregans TaxID=570835 RepID=UPI0005561E20|nr:type II toxin-antitoxin system HigB family toxin [Edaphobacter aggregans]
MHVVTLKHLNVAATKYPDAAKEIAAWHLIVKESRWTDFIDVQKTFPDADAVDGYVVFNIRHNRYRLVTVIHYARDRQGVQTMGHVYIRSFLTHKQYDSKANWDKEFGK